MVARVSNGPRVRVAGLIVIDDRVVLVRHHAGDARYHLLPGGGVHYRETLEDALLREVREETGLVVEVGPLLIVNDTIDPNGRRHVVNLTFSCTVRGGAITQSPEDARVEAVDLVEPAALATMDLRPPLATAIIEAIDRADAYQAQYLGSLFTPGGDRR